MARADQFGLTPEEKSEAARQAAAAALAALDAEPTTPAPPPTPDVAPPAPTTPPDVVLPTPDLGPTAPDVRPDLAPNLSPPTPAPEALQLTRERYARAREGMRQYESLMGSLKGFVRPTTRWQVEREFYTAKDEYERVKGEIIAGRVDQYADEQIQLTDALMVSAAARRERSMLRAIRQGWEWFGNMNLYALYKATTGKEATSAAGRFIGKVLSVRTGIMTGLAVGGVMTGGALGVGMLAGRAAMAAVGGTIASHDVMKAWAQRKGAREELEKLTSETIRGLTYEDARKLLGEVEIDARMRGYKVADIPLYKDLAQHYYRLDHAELLTESLEGRARLIEEQVQRLDKKSRRDAGIRKGIAVAAGATLGAWSLARGLLSAHEAAQPMPKGGEVTDKAVSPPEKGAVILPTETETLESFASKHNLLKAQGFEISKVGDKWQVLAEIGKGKDFDQLQQALRRLVVDAMDPGKLHGGKVFDAIDAGRAENMVANVTRILRDHLTTNQISLAELNKLGISWDGKILKIADHSAFAKLFDEKLFSHAVEIINAQSDALETVSKTAHRLWQQMWDQKMGGSAVTGAHPVEVADFAQDDLVKGATQRVAGRLLENLGLGEGAHLAQTVHGDSWTATVEGFTVEADDGIITGLTAPDGSAVALPAEGLPLRETVSGATIRDRIDTWQGAHGGGGVAAAQAVETASQALDAKLGAVNESFRSIGSIAHSIGSGRIEVDYPGGKIFGTVVENKLTQVGSHALKSAVDLNNAEAIKRAFTAVYAPEDILRQKPWGILDSNQMAEIGKHKFSQRFLETVFDDNATQFVHQYGPQGLRSTVAASLHPMMADQRYLAEIIATKPPTQLETVGDWLMRAGH